MKNPNQVMLGAGATIGRIRCGLLGLALLGFSALSAAEHRETKEFEVHRGHEVAAGEVLVKFRPGSPAHARAAVEREEDIDAAESVGSGGAVRMHSRSRNAAALVDSLSQRADVEYAELNYKVQALMLPNEPPRQFASEWAMLNTGQSNNRRYGIAGADIRATLAWDLTTGSNANVVAILDTGIDYRHADLAANIWSAPADYTVNVGGVAVTCLAGTHGFNVLTMTCDPLDDNNHGTHVAGIVGAVGNNGVGVAGVNWTASIMAVKFLDAAGMGTVADAVNAIEYVIQARHVLGAGANVRLLSNSWGLLPQTSNALLDAINKADLNEMLFVAAAGNNYANNDVAPNYPSNFATHNMLAVAATDQADYLARFSNFGPTTVHLGAPGVDIVSTIPYSGYAYKSGTSMATPHVAGAAALLLARDGNLSVDDLRNTILGTVDLLPSLAGQTTTGGRLNLFKAVSSVPVPPPPNFRIDLAAPDQQTVPQGATAAYAVALTAANGFADTINLGIAGLPPGAAATFAPAPLVGPGTAAIAVSTDATTPVGSYLLTLAASSGTLAHTLTLSLLVDPAPADFTLAAALAAQSVVPGANVNYPIDAIGLNSFTGTVDLSVAGLPPGATAVFTPAAIVPGSQSIMSVATLPTTPPGSYALSVSGTTGALVHTLPLSLIVDPVPFTSFGPVPLAP